MSPQVAADPVTQWVAVVGDSVSGKREALQRIVAGLRARGVTVGGAVQEPVSGGSDSSQGYDLVDLGTGARVPFARPSGAPDICGLGFDIRAFETATRWITACPAQVVVLEAGKLEAAKTGHWPQVVSVVEARHGSGVCVLVLCVRPSVLAAVVCALPDPVASIELPANGPDVDQLIDDVASLCSSRRSRTPR